MKKKHVIKIILKILAALIVIILLFTLGTFIYHRINTNNELMLLKENGYYNPVSVGDYSLNVAKFGNESGKHTVVSLAGLGAGDFSVAERQMTSYIESDNLVAFIDRAGYGLSDDTDNDMTLEYIVEDYRKALKNAGVPAPYVLMAHSIGGAYATYWESVHPEEIEAVVFVDGSELSETAFSDEPSSKVDFGDKTLAFFAKLGFSRYVLRDYCYRYPDGFSNEQKLGDILNIMTMDSIAPVSEGRFLAENAQNSFNQIVTNNIPKLYICANLGIRTANDLNELSKWINLQIEDNGLDTPMKPTDFEENDEETKEELANYEKARNELLYPYIEKLGNCKLAFVPGDHTIYIQKPDECGKLISEFIADTEK